MLTLEQFRGVGSQVARRAIDPTKERPLADPTASFWTLRDLGQLFDRRDIAAQVAHWRKRHGFPAPLPWSARPLKWRPAPVLAWKAAREAENG
jgi:hypothetical protein